MNDFLDNLAERAMNAEQDVRPRLPSLFEPAMPVSEPAWQERVEPAGVESFDVTLEQEASDAAPVKSFSQRQSSELKRDSQSSEQSDRSLAIGRMLSPAHQVFQPDAQAPVVSARFSEAAPDNRIEQASPKPSMATLRPKLSSSANDNEHRDVEARLASVSESREVEARSPQVSLLIATRANPVAQVNVSRDEAPAIEAARNEASTPLVVRPKLNRYVEPPMPRPQTQSTLPPNEQIINVTIGRIEVRATPPPATTSRSNNQRPTTISLDDYLRQRSGTNRGGGA